MAAKAPKRLLTDDGADSTEEALLAAFDAEGDDDGGVAIDDGGG